jgi:Sec7-like guanine-nucleotide exchange factor
MIMVDEILTYIAANAPTASLALPPASVSSGSDNILASIIGAAIGGFISVGLAIMMFRHERKVAKNDAKKAAQDQRIESIRQSLRYVRAIRECIANGRRININDSVRILSSIRESSKLSRRALEDINLSDFDLRLAMEDAAKIGFETANNLDHELSQSGLQDANIALNGADAICNSAIDRIRKLEDKYSDLRKVPAL